MVALRSREGVPTPTRRCSTSLETYPRDELIPGPEEELLATGLGVLEMQSATCCACSYAGMFHGRFFSCMVYVTKERYNTALQVKTQQRQKFWQQL